MCSVNLSHPENGWYDENDLCPNQVVQTVKSTVCDQTMRLCKEHAWDLKTALSAAKHGWYIVGDEESSRIANICAAWCDMRYLAMKTGTEQPAKPSDIAH